jgi:hypothetical protein
LTAGFFTIVTGCCFLRAASCGFGFAIFDLLSLDLPEPVDGKEHCEEHRVLPDDLVVQLEEPTALNLVTDRRGTESLDANHPLVALEQVPDSGLRSPS